MWDSWELAACYWHSLTSPLSILFTPKIKERLEQPSLEMWRPSKTEVTQNCFHFHLFQLLILCHAIIGFSCVYQDKFVMYCGHKSLTSSYECAVQISLEVFSVIDVILSCAQKANYRVLAGLSVVFMFWYVGWCISDRKGQEPDVLIFLSSLKRTRVLSFSCSYEIWSLHESFPACH